jgi:ABC-type transporter Mla MlaB component
MHVYVHGKLSSKIGPGLQEAAEKALAEGLFLVVHLKSVRQITATGLGALMGVRRQLLEEGLTVSLTGLNRKQRFLLFAWCALPLFDEWESASFLGQSAEKDWEVSPRLDLHAKQDVLAEQPRASS